MTVKIKVDDADFSAFYTKFKQFQAAAENTPETWKRVAASAEVARQNYESLSEEARKHSDSTDEAVQRVGRLGHALDAAGRGIHRLEKSSAGLAKNVGEATLSILKWAGIAGIVGGIVGGAGSILAVDRFASRVTAARTGAMGVGTTPGHQRAADIAYSRFVGTGFSSRIAEMQHDVNSVAALKRLLPGMSAEQIASADPNDLIGPLLSAGRKKARGLQKGQLFNDPSLNNVFSHEQINTLASGEYKDGEIGEARTRYGADREKFEYSNSKAWADFERTLEESKSKLQSAFINKLAALTDPLGSLTESATKFATKLIDSKLAETVIDALAGGMDWLADNIDKPEFRKKITDFFAKFGEMAKEIGNLASGALSFVEWLTGNDNAKAETPPGGPVSAGGGRRTFMMNKLPHDNSSFQPQQGYGGPGTHLDPSLDDPAPLKWGRVRHGDKIVKGASNAHQPFLMRAPSRNRPTADRRTHHILDGRLHQLHMTTEQRHRARLTMDGSAPADVQPIVIVNKPGGRLAGGPAQNGEAPARTAQITVSHAAGSNPADAAAAVGTGAHQ